MKPLEWITHASVGVTVAVICGIFALIGAALAFWGREAMIVRCLMATYLAAGAAAVVGGALALSGTGVAAVAAGTFVLAWFMGHVIYEVSGHWDHARLSVAAVVLAVATGGLLLSVALPLVAAAGGSVPFAKDVAAFFTDRTMRAVWFVAPFVVALLLRR